MPYLINVCYSVKTKKCGRNSINYRNAIIELKFAIMVTFLKSAQNSKLLGCKSWDQALMRKNNISKKAIVSFLVFSSLFSKQNDRFSKNPYLQQTTF